MGFDIDIRKKLGRANIGLKVVADMRTLVLQGPSGVGKTTILNMVAGLITPDSGHIRIDDLCFYDAEAGIYLSPAARRTGYVFQDGRLFSHMNVRENLLYGWKLAAPAHRWMDLDEAVAFLGLEELLDRAPDHLSGGEAQRVAIGRALLSGPQILLLDEPLNSVDPARRMEIMRVILRIRDELQLPIIYVTHDALEARQMSGAAWEVARG